MAATKPRQKEVTTREVASIRFGMYSDDEVRTSSSNGSSSGSYSRQGSKCHILAAESLKHCMNIIHKGNRDIRGTVGHGQPGLPSKSSACRSVCRGGTSYRSA